MATLLQKLQYSDKKSIMQHLNNITDQAIESNIFLLGTFLSNRKRKQKCTKFHLFFVFLISNDFQWFDVTQRLKKREFIKQRYRLPLQITITKYISISDNTETKNIK